MKLKPIFINGKKFENLQSDPSNSRPISLLPVISKIIETVVHGQTYYFVSDEHIQTTNLAFEQIIQQIFLFHFLTDKSQKRFDEGLLTRMILIDLQKAFDIIVHETSLKKTKAIRFSRGTLQQLFRYYISELIFLNIKSKLSDFGKYFLWGTTRVYLKFSFVSDLCEYADDSYSLCQHKKVDEIEKQLHNDFENTCDWFVVNKLRIHFGEDKSVLIVFASKRRSNHVCQLNIRYNHINIKQHSQVIYLWCVLDEKM